MPGAVLVFISWALFSSVRLPSDPSTTAAAALSCTYCLDVFDPVHDAGCNTTHEDCSVNEECYAAKYISHDGASRYSFQCKPTRYCDVLRKLAVGRRQLVNNQITVCQQCCSSTKCNRNLCQ